MAQAVIFNRIALFGVAMAFVFIYFIIKLPITMGQTKVIFLSFLLGVAMDIFSDTPGMNALACTCLGACRHTILRLYLSREDDVSHSIPSIRSLGATVYAKYVLTMSGLYCTLIFVIEAFTFFHPLQLLLRIVASTALTWLLLMSADSFNVSRSAR